MAFGKGVSSPIYALRLKAIDQLGEDESEMYIPKHFSGTPCCSILSDGSDGTLQIDESIAPIFRTHSKHTGVCHHGRRLYDTNFALRRQPNAACLASDDGQ